MMLIKLFLFCVILALSNGNPRPISPKRAIAVQDCTNAPVPVDAPAPVNVIVPSCAAPPCILHKGETYEVEIDFEYNSSNFTNNLKVDVNGIIAGIELPWNGVGENGCSELVAGECPMKLNDFFTYATAIKVESTYPSTKLIIKWQMIDDDDKPIWCFTLPAEIKA